MSNLELRTFEGTVEIRANEDGSESRTIEGYGIVFNRWSKTLGGWFREKIEPSAMNNVDLTSVRATFNHNDNYIMARTESGTLDLTIDDIGVKYRFEAPNTTAGNDLLENIRVKNVTGSSFTFMLPERGGTVWSEGEDGIEERTITQFAGVMEMGPVTNPAYPDTTAAKRDYETSKEEAEKLKEESNENKEFVRSVIDAERKYKQLRAKI